MKQGSRMVQRRAARGFALLCAGFLAGCAGEATEFLREPKLTAVGQGVTRADSGEIQGLAALGGGQSPQPSYLVNGGSLYTDQRITRVGDIVTVLIAINDKATFGNESDRSRTSTNNFLADWNFQNNLGATAAAAASQPSSVSGDLTSSSSTQGTGNINRQEQIQVSIAAVVTNVLPNGNLVVSGSQEVRVNFELRQLTVAGVIRPSDVSRNNTITYDRIAEARISYGGRGRLNDMQQPAWGQQLVDFLRPF